MQCVHTTGKQSDGEEDFKRFGKMLEIMHARSEGNHSDGTNP